MQVITTHLNADFDCLASMVAASKLYPDARLVLSGSAEKTVNAYLKSFPGTFNFHRVRDIDLEQVTLLIMVDTQDVRRIGVFESLVGKPGVEVHVFDHHLDIPEPVAAQQAMVRKRGSTTTLMIELLTEKNIVLNSHESTLMLLGIYQDTHSLLSASTTPEDLTAAAQMVRTGADLNVVSQFVQPRLNSQQVEVLNELIGALETNSINGVEVTLATAALDHYVDDLAYVVHQVMDLENLSTVFALIGIERRVYLIARCKTGEVNVAEVARTFGGGGHSNAASASVRDLTLVQARENLLEVLASRVRPLHLVGDIMHYPVVSVLPGDSIQSVEKTMTRFNLNSLPVVCEGKPVGLVTRQIVEKAIHHKLHKERTEDFMVREFSVSSPAASFKSIVPVVIEEKQKIVPVVDVDTGIMVGIVSRGDLLRVFQGDLVSGERSSLPLLDEKAGMFKNVKSLMKERLDKNLMGLLESIGHLADDTRVLVYVVGGFVRDLLLGLKNFDVDIVVDGDGIEFARTLGTRLRGRVKSHAKFGTSVVVLEDGFRIDVATARMEFYKHPGALPTVEKSSIKADLFRRDFTLNSLAVKLNGSDQYSLIDYFNGERDLKDKVLRVLHNLSFIEDPCRIFRAIRFEQRFHFSIGKQTEGFMRGAIEKKMVNQLSGSRLLNEMILLFKEEDPLRCIQRMKEFDLFKFISPHILSDPQNMKAMERIDDVLAWSKMVPLTRAPEIWFVYFFAVLGPLKNSSFVRAIERLRVPMRLRNRIETDRVAFSQAVAGLQGDQTLEPSAVYDIFSNLSSEAVIYLLAVLNSQRVNKLATLFYTQYHSMATLSLTGKDLIRLGMKPGPEFQRVFKTLRDARVNGTITSRAEEEALVQERFLNS